MDTTQNAICHWLPFQCGNQSDGFQLSYSVYAMRTVIWSVLKKKKSDGLKASAAGFFKILFLKLLFSICSKNSVEFWGRYYCGLLQHWFGINNSNAVHEWITKLKVVHYGFYFLEAKQWIYVLFLQYMRISFYSLM